MNLNLYFIWVGILSLISLSVFPNNFIFRFAIAFVFGSLLATESFRIKD